MTAWLESIVHGLLAALALPSVGLSTLFIWCTASATLLPLGSEVYVAAYNQLNPHHEWLIITVATIGNTLGGMINYGLAWRARRATTKTMTQAPKALQWLERLGAKALFFSFLPVIGDPLTAVAGWLQLPWLPCLLWQATGKGLRYIGVLILIDMLPDMTVSAWWNYLNDSMHSLIHNLNFFN